LWARKAARRSSTSAIETIHEHAPPDRPNPVHRTLGRPWAQLLGAASFRSQLRTGGCVPCGIRPVETSWARGLAFRILRSAASASLAAIACERGLHPDPINSDISCRQFVTMQPWKTLHRQALDGCPLTNSPSSPHLFAWAALKGRFPRSPAKRSAIVCTRDAFHHRIAPGGAGLSSTSCPQPVDY
jgi:hypothetical protein